MQKLFFKNSKGVKIAAVLDLPFSRSPLPLVLALHGFGATKDDDQEWAEILNPLNIATFRIDFSGSGESEGKFEDKTITGFLDDAASALDYISTLLNVDQNKLGVVGHSMGATTGILIAAKDPRIKTLIASVPAIYPKDVMANLYSPEEIEKHRDRKKLNNTFFEDAKKYNIIKEGVKIPYQFLVIGAVKDEVVAFEQIKEFTDVVKNSKLLVLPNSGHDLEADWNLVKEVIYNWFRNWLRL